MTREEQMDEDEELMRRRRKKMKRSKRRGQLERKRKRMISHRSPALLNKIANLGACLKPSDRQRHVRALPDRERYTRRALTNRGRHRELCLAEKHTELNQTEEVIESST